MYYLFSRQWLRVNVSPRKVVYAQSSGRAQDLIVMQEMRNDCVHKGIKRVKQSAATKRWCHGRFVQRSKLLSFSFRARQKANSATTLLSIWPKVRYFGQKKFEEAIRRPDTEAVSKSFVGFVSFLFVCVYVCSFLFFLQRGRSLQACPFGDYSKFRHDM